MEEYLMQLYEKDGVAIISYRLSTFVEIIG